MLAEILASNKSTLCRIASLAFSFVRRQATVMVLMRLAVGRKNKNNKLKKTWFVACSESGFNQIGFLGKIGLLPKKKRSFLLFKVNQSC